VEVICAEEFVLPKVKTKMKMKAILYSNFMLNNSSCYVQST
jgi:hypothetical protein